MCSKFIIKKVNREKKGVLMKQAEFEFIHEHAKDFPLAVLFRLTSVSYKWLKRYSTPRIDRDEGSYHLNLAVFNESNGTYDVRRIKQELLNKYGSIVNHKCIRRIMRNYHLACLLPKPQFKRRPQPHGKISNVLNREFHATKPLQKLCIDSTSIKVKAPYPKWVYLCAVKDVYIIKKLLLMIVVNLKIWRKFIEYLIS